MAFASLPVMMQKDKKRPWGQIHWTVRESKKKKKDLKGDITNFISLAHEY